MSSLPFAEGLLCAKRVLTLWMNTLILPLSRAKCGSDTLWHLTQATQDVVEGLGFDAGSGRLQVLGSPRPNSAASKTQ